MHSLLSLIIYYITLIEITRLHLEDYRKNYLAFELPFKRAKRPVILLKRIKLLLKRGL